MPDTAPPDPRTDAPMLDIRLDGDTLRFAGRLSIARISETERMLHQLLEPVAGPLSIDLSGVSRIDTVGAWMIHRLLRDRPGSSLVGASPDAERLIKEVAAADRPCDMRPPQEPFLARELERLGRYVILAWVNLAAILGFIGLSLISAWHAVSSRRGVRWGAVTVQMEQVGVNALGIIGLMSFLIGIVLAQQGRCSCGSSAPRCS